MRALRSVAACVVLGWVTGKQFEFESWKGGLCARAEYVLSQSIRGSQVLVDRLGGSGLSVL